jgi:hypothetical protein
MHNAVNCRDAQVVIIFIIFMAVLYVAGDTRWSSGLGHCATNRKVAGSIPDNVTGFFL